MCIFLMKKYKDISNAEHTVDHNDEARSVLIRLRDYEGRAGVGQNNL